MNARPSRESSVQRATYDVEVPVAPNDITRRRAVLARSSSSKSKSRFVEPPYPSVKVQADADQGTHVVGSNTRHTSQSNISPRVSADTPNTTFATSRSSLAQRTEVEEEYEDVYKCIDAQANQLWHKRLKVYALMELTMFITLMGLLTVSLIDYDLQGISVWSLKLWVWCVLLIVLSCGRLITECIINLVVYLVGKKLIFKKKVLYFVFGLKRSVQVFLWLSFVLLAWIFLVVHGNNRSRQTTRVLHYITLAIAGCVVGAGIWLVKTLLIKTLALHFHVKKFFDRIQESLFHQYVLQTLSGTPSMEMTESVVKSRNSNQLSFKRMTKDKRVKEEVINVEKLHKINHDKVCAWTMKGLINIIRRTNLSTISGTLDSGENEETEEQNKEIKCEWEAKAAAAKIFNNVAKSGYEYIEEEDLLRFLNMNEVNQVLPSFGGAAETGKITKLALEKWVVNAYKERKSLAHSLNDTKTAIEELNNLASGVVLIVIIIVWNLMMGFLTTKILVFVASQLLLVAFVFGNSIKTVFEGIIFVFVMHPFDVGDRCVVDGVQMVVEEMNILTTIFLRYDNEKITYPNSVLATKPISNFYRSPEMCDSLEFAIDFSTKVETIAALKERIKSYIESKPQQWRASHSIQLKDIVDVNKIMVELNVTHTINFQNIEEKRSRRSDLVLELKKILEDLGIRYHLLPQDVHVTYLGSPAAASAAYS